MVLELLYSFMWGNNTFFEICELFSLKLRKKMKILVQVSHMMNFMNAVRANRILSWKALAGN